MGHKRALPLMCFGRMGFLLVFARMIDILALFENFPLFISLSALYTGLLSDSLISGSLLSLIRLYSLSIPTPSLNPSISQGHHFLHLSGSRIE